MSSGYWWRPSYVIFSPSSCFPVSFHPSLAPRLFGVYRGSFRGFQSPNEKPGKSVEASRFFLLPFISIGRNGDQLRSPRVPKTWMGRLMGQSGRTKDHGSIEFLEGRRGRCTKVWSQEHSGFNLVVKNLTPKFVPSFHQVVWLHPNENSFFWGCGESIYLRDIDRTPLKASQSGASHRQSSPNS